MRLRAAGGVPGEPDEPVAEALPAAFSCAKGLEPGCEGVGADVMLILRFGASEVAVCGFGVGVGVGVGAGEDRDELPSAGFVSLDDGAGAPSLARRRARI